MLIAACQRTGMGRESAEAYLQLEQQRDRAKGRETASWRTWRACWAGPSRQCERACDRASMRRKPVQTC
ncbi:hypothetical protein AB0A81_40295 [Streptomyces flaveolus]|uniref:Uncharacterized protein n=1 Tax=Streptomyces flaveolus TaxID=67297 RepID=A0ABV1VIL5_9ACTN